MMPLKNARGRFCGVMGLTAVLATTVAVNAQQTSQTLREAFADDFLIGAALSTRLPGGHDKVSTSMIAAQFNQVTPENCMKFGQIHPQPDRYNFTPADQLVAFAEKNKMTVVGHVLVWHNQTPDWVFENAQGKNLTRDELIARMRKHMEAVLGRYKGRIKGWDVVNEAFNGNGTMRRTKWFEIIGADLLEVAFRNAHAVDPNIELYYNDYGMTGGGKRNATVKLIEEFKAKGIRIDGVGMQGHWGLGGPSIDAIEQSIITFAKTGVKVHITELDVDVLPGRKPNRGGDLTKEQYQKEVDPYRNGLPDDMQQRLAKRYAALFGLFLKHKDKIARVTFWGASDKYSWKNNYPIRGRVNHALLFDREAKPKPAFHAVMRLKSK